MENKVKPLLYCLILLLVAVLSFTFIADRLSSPETYTGLLASIDDKIDTVMGLTAASTVASAVVSAIPDDTATPIADKLADFAEYFLVVLCVLYSEKYLLTVTGAAAFRIVIPLACILAIISIVKVKRGNLRSIAAKLAIIGVTLYLLTPVSIEVSDSIYSVYRTSIDSTIAAAGDISGQKDIITESDGSESAEENEHGSVFGAIANTVVNLTDKAADILRNFVEALAVLIVTSCVIPLLALLFFLWLIKTLTGIDIRAKVTKLPGAVQSLVKTEKHE